MNHYLRYLPLTTRIELSDKINRPKKIEKTKRFYTRKIDFFVSRLISIYNIDFNQENDVFEDQSFQNKSIVVKEKKRQDECTILQKGIPLLNEIIFKLFNDNNFTFSLFEIPLSFFFYIFSSPQKIVSDSTYFDQKIYRKSVYFRSLEDGSMIKIERKPEDYHEKRDKLMTYDNYSLSNIYVIEDDHFHFYTSFYDKINRFITDLLSKISHRKDTDIFFRSLSDLIIKSNNYSKIHIAKIFKNHNLSSTFNRNTKKIKTGSTHRETDPVYQSCKISNCPSLFKKNDDKELVYAIYFYKNVFEEKNAKTKPNKYDYAIKMCLEHGQLIICIWYLLNHLKIWTSTIIENIMIDLKNNHTRFQIFTYFQRIVEKTNILIKEKEKIDVSLQYLEKWQNKYLLD